MCCAHGGGKAGPPRTGPYATSFGLGFRALPQESVPPDAAINAPEEITKNGLLDACFVYPLLVCSDDIIGLAVYSSPVIIFVRV